jgi:hypothetical protein
LTSCLQFPLVREFQLHRIVVVVVVNKRLRLDWVHGASGVNGARAARGRAAELRLDRKRAEIRLDIETIQNLLSRVV